MWNCKWISKKKYIYFYILIINICIPAQIYLSRPVDGSGFEPQ